MGNCLSRPKRKRKVVIGTCGLDNAGKTSVVKVLKGDSLNDVTPTVGFASVSFEDTKFHITLYDLGGGARIRDIWKNYFPEVYGVLFVIDAGDQERLQEAGQVFTAILQNSKMQGKPILLLLNKQDVEGAFDEVDANEQLNLGSIVNKYKSPCRVETCVATKGTGKRCDSNIRAGFQWLLDQIDSRYEKLSGRVTDDMKEAKVKQEADRAERIERIRRIREEREKAEAETEEKEDDSSQDQTKSRLHRCLPFEPLPKISVRLDLYLYRVLHCVPV